MGLFSMDPTKLSNSSLLRTVIISTAIIVAPGWYIFQFAPAIFFKTDLPRLFIICCAIGIPLILLNTIFVRAAISALGLREKGKYEVDDFTVAALATLLVLYLPSFLSWKFFDNKISLHSAISMSRYTLDALIGLGVIFVLVMKRIFKRADLRTRS
ncbi:MAG: hypothetical protein JWM28_2049 [Chitinophagaceae bacterium]|nr:hypothetical protein [Chitinophagaceae bacterium]